MKALSLWHGNVDARPSIAEVAAMVAARHRLGVIDLTGRSRLRRISWARQEAMYEALRLTRFSTTVVGKFFNRDHSTVVHARQAHLRRIALRIAAE